MKAWLIEKHGGNEVLNWTDMISRDPGPSEARLRVNMVGLNHLDVWLRNGVEGHNFSLPMVPGGDVVGTIENIGALSQESRFSLQSRGLIEGQRVLVNPLLSCGICGHCSEGFPPLCRQFGILGETALGGCAEFVTVPLDNLIPLPAEIQDEEAATLPIAYITAWSMLTRKVNLKPGQLVFVQSGGSGTGVACIQIAKLFGCTVITSVGSKEKVAKAEALGADYVICATPQSFRKEVRNITRKLDRSGVDIAVDHVGKQTLPETLKCLAWGGKLLVCGATTGSDITLDFKMIFFKNLSILGSTMGGRQDLLKIVELVKEKKLNPIIDSVMLMSHLPQALTALESRKPFGKVVLKNP